MQINRSNVLGLIEPHLEQHIVEEYYEVTTVPAIKFLTYLRFDLAFKLFYLDLLDKHIEFPASAYKEHIRAFSLGEFNEPGNENKNSIECFYDEFKKIFCDINKNGFDSSKTLIPLSKNGNILNGAHRIASAIKSNKSVVCVNLDISCPNYDYKFFSNRHVPIEMLDAAAVKFIEYANNTYIACIWPTAQGNDDEIESVIPNIIYRKNISLSNNGAHNFISQIYAGEDWLGDVNNNFQGVKSKLVECFKKEGPLRVIAFQANSLDRVLKVKEDIRSLFDLGKHSIHITDTTKEALDISRLVFNDNSVHFLNYAKPNTFLDFHKNLIEVRRFLQLNNIKEEDFALDGGMVLAAYGLRKANDIDFFTSENTHISRPMDNFDPHDSELKFYKKQKNELIYDPRNYFHFQNLKYITFSQLFLMKQNRAEEKDNNDCQTMKALLDKKHFQKNISQIRQYFFYKKISFKTKLLKSLQAIGLFHLLRTIYRFMKDKR